MMKRAWGAYVKHAWGANEVAANAKTRQDSLFGKYVIFDWTPTSSLPPRHSWGCVSIIHRVLDGVTIVDAFDTLVIMELKEEAQKAHDWLVTDLVFNKVRTRIHSSRDY
jgi:hypothetical protein